MKREFRSSWLSFADLVAVLALAGTAVATAAVYAQLPARVATHFDVLGRPNGWMSRPLGAWFLPALNAALWLLVRFAARLVPAARREWRARLAQSPLGLVGAIIAVFLSAVHLLILRFALAGEAFDMGRAIVALLGTMWIALGLVFPRVRRNPLIGVRTAWTLVSDENWARTHRVASYACIVGGLCALTAAAVGRPAAYAMGFAAFITSALVPVAYSWVYARRA